jgi:uncharacterized protein YidB (DUF937 family)
LVVADLVVEDLATFSAACSAAAHLVAADPPEAAAAWEIFWVGAPGGGAPGRGMPPGGGGAGGLGDILGGLLGGAGAGSALNGGLGDLLRQFEQSGQGDASRSWVGTGPNKAISPQDLESALGGDTLDTLSQHIGMGRGALANELSQQLPRFVDQLTPNGRLPTHEEAARML